MFSTILASALDILTMPAVQAAIFLVPSLIILICAIVSWVGENKAEAAVKADAKEVEAVAEAETEFDEVASDSAPSAEEAYAFDDGVYAEPQAEAEEIYEAEILPDDETQSDYAAPSEYAASAPEAFDYQTDAAAPTEDAQIYEAEPEVYATEEVTDENVEVFEADAFDDQAYDDAVVEMVEDEAAPESVELVEEAAVEQAPFETAQSEAAYAEPAEQFEFEEVAETAETADAADEQFYDNAEVAEEITEQAVQEDAEPQEIEPAEAEQPEPEFVPEPDLQSAEEPIAEEAAPEAAQSEEQAAVEAEAPVDKPQEKQSDFKMVSAPKAQNEKTEKYPLSSDVKGAKFVIVTQADGKFCYYMVDDKGKALYRSRSYAARINCEKAIDNFRNYVVIGEVKYDCDVKTSIHRFVLRFNKTFYVGLPCTSRMDAEETFASVMKFAQNAPITLENEDTKSDESALEPTTNNLTGIEPPENPGKYLIVPRPNGKYKFTLSSDTSFTLYDSKEYSSKSACKNAVATFQKNVQCGEYKIASESGRYYYIITNGKTYHVGEPCKTKTRAMEMLELVKQFAYNSTIVDVKA